jgi:hypothetical protein
MPITPTPGSNSTIPLQEVVDHARAFGVLTPVMKGGGYADQPARDIADEVMSVMLGGGFIDGRKVGPFPWKWNRIYPPPFLTNSWQQDYASLGFNTLAWLQHGVWIDINNTAPRQPYGDLEIVRDLELTGGRGPGRPFQICWLRNKDLQYGVWGGGVTSGVGAQNPAAGSVYANPLGAASPPNNPVTQLLDANGNFLVLTGYGKEGTTPPVAPANSAPGTIATPGAGSTTQWTVADPFGQGFRLSPAQPQTALTYQINLVGQARPVRFTSLTQLLDPVPDDFGIYVKRGFVVECYRRSPEKNILAKFETEFKLWMIALQEALGKASHEREGFGFFPDKGIMDVGPVTVTDAGWPFAPTGQ